MTTPAGFLSVMQARRSPPDELDFFPTPPWATRALVEHVLKPAWSNVDFGGARAIDPCCGEGHMIETLAESFGETEGSDVFDYGRGYAVRDVLDLGRFERIGDAFVITNPPFTIALDIALAALCSARRPRAVCLLMRSNWIEGVERYERLFRHMPPSFIAPFVERVPMVKGRYDPTASTATAYSWFGWLSGQLPFSRSVLIPPCRRKLELAEDVRRWCRPAAAPLLDGAIA